MPRVCEGLAPATLVKELTLAAKGTWGLDNPVSTFCQAECWRACGDPGPFPSGSGVSVALLEGSSEGSSNLSTSCHRTVLGVRIFYSLTFSRKRTNV